MSHRTPPPTLADELRQLTISELSWAPRLRYVALLLSASTMSAVVFALLLTEGSLPLRTTIALSALGVIGVSWVIFAGWVLSRRRVLLGRHGVIAGRLAVTFTSVFVGGAAFTGFATGRSAGFAAAALGGVMLCIAVSALARARRRFSALSARRQELSRLIERRHS